MNKNIKNIFRAFAVCLSILALNSCGEEATLDLASPSTGARVKFLHAVPAGPAYTVLLNNQKWSSVLVSAKYTDSITLGNSFPAIDYATVAPGSSKFAIRQPLSVDAAGTTVAEGTFSIEDGKYYMVIAADSATKPKLYLVPDARYSFKDVTQTGLKFTNFLVNTPESGYSFYLKRNPTPFATLKYGESGEYTEFLPTGTLTDTVVTRVPGSTAIVHSFALGSSKLSANRTYNFLLRGRLNGTSTQAPTLTFFTSN